MFLHRLFLVASLFMAWLLMLAYSSAKQSERLQAFANFSGGKIIVFESHDRVGIRFEPSRRLLGPASEVNIFVSYPVDSS